jgi:hypothetical protein
MVLVWWPAVWLTVMTGCRLRPNVLESIVMLSKLNGQGSGQGNAVFKVWPATQSCVESGGKLL